MTNWVLFDGECPMCRRLAHWAQQHDTRGQLRIVPYQEAPSPPMTPALHQACAGAMHVVTGRGEVLRGGQAALWVLERVGFRRLARTLSQPMLGPLIEAGYALIAANRSRIGRWVLPNEPQLEAPPEAPPAKPV